MIILVSFLFQVGIGLLTTILAWKSIDFLRFFPSVSPEVLLNTWTVASSSLLLLLSSLLLSLFSLLFLNFFQAFANIVDPGDLVKLLECKFWFFVY